jgi:hypothetical protein
MCPAERVSETADCGGRHGSPAKQRTDAGLELKNVEGLRDIIVRARFEAQKLVRILAAGGEHDDRHRGKSANLLAGLQTVQPGHHQVEYDDIVAVLPGHLDGGLAVVAGIHPVALVLKVELDPLTSAFIVTTNIFIEHLPR